MLLTALYGLVAEEPPANLIRNHVQCNAVFCANVDCGLILDRTARSEDGGSASVDESLRSVRKRKE